MNSNARKAFREPKHNELGRREFDRFMILIIFLVKFMFIRLYFLIISNQAELT